MSVPKGSIHTMQSIITKKNNIMYLVQKNTPVEKQQQHKEPQNINSSRFQKMHLKNKTGVSHLAHRESKKNKVSSTHYTGRWMSFMYRDPNKPRGGCGVCYNSGS